MHRVVAIGLLVCSAAVAGHEQNPSKDWNRLREKNLQLGLPVERVDQTLGACRKSGLPVENADALLCSVYTAQAEGLPTECVFLKIEEGLAKRIAWTDVQAAAGNRLDCLRRADQLVMSGRQERGGQHQHLVMHTCVALESGLPEEVIQSVFSRPGGFRYGRVIHVIEAGETLQLSGLAPKDTLHIMHDCLDRNLNGIEVSRVVDVVLAGHRAGKDFETIHAGLWVQSN